MTATASRRGLMIFPNVDAGLFAGGGQCAGSQCAGAVGRGAGGDRFEEKIFKGPLARMTREALSYIQRNYLRETVIKHPDRAEATRVWNFPYAAIKEALGNAGWMRIPRVALLGKKLGAMSHDH